MNTQHLTQLPEGWESIARMFAVPDDGTRQKILLLGEQDKSITLKTFVDMLPCSRSAVVHHVTVQETQCG